MKNLTIKLLLVCSLPFACLSSCTKLDYKNPCEDIAGTWRKSKTGMDLNKDGKPADDELNTLPESSEFVTLNSDHSGYSMDRSFSNSFNWAIDANTLTITENGNQTVMIIRKITSSEMIILDQRSSPGTWTGYTK